MQLNGLDSSQKIICASIATKVLPENYFHQIPLEIIDLIFNKLDNPSRGQCEKTSRLWKSIATTYKQEQDFLIEKFIDQLITPLAKDYPDIYEACKKILTDHPLKKYNISFIEKESLKIKFLLVDQFKHIRFEDLSVENIYNSLKFPLFFEDFFRLIGIFKKKLDYTAAIEDFDDSWINDVIALFNICSMDLCDLGYFDKAFELINLIILTHNQTYERSKCYYHIMFKMLTNGISLKEIEALPQFEKITFHKKKLLKNYDLISSVANVNQESIFEKILAETEKAQEILVDNFNFNDLIKYLHWTCAFDNKERLFSMGIYKLVQKSTTPQHLAECVQIYRNFSGKSSEISSNYDSLITGYASIGFFQQANELLEEFIKLSHETAITLIPEQKNIYEKKMIDFAKSIKQRVEIFKK